MSKDPTKWLDFHLENLSMSRADHEWEDFQKEFKIGEFLGDQNSFVFKAHHKYGNECVLKFFSGEEEEIAENEHAIITKLKKLDIDGVVRVSRIHNGILRIGCMVVLILASDPDDGHIEPSTEQGKLSFAKQLKNVLLAVHNAGFSHGDVKPCNLMWNPRTEKLTLIDWGEARCGRSSTLVSDCGGTLEYLSDDRFKKGILSVTTIEDIQRADLWAAGICIAEPLLGTYAYDSNLGVPRNTQLRKFMLKFDALPHDEAWHIANDFLKDEEDNEEEEEEEEDEDDEDDEEFGHEIPWIGIGLVSAFVVFLAFVISNH